MQAVNSPRWTTDQYGNSVRVSDAVLHATATDNGVVMHRVKRDDIAEYNKFRAIDRMMRERHGVNM